MEPNVQSETGMERGSYMEYDMTMIQGSAAATAKRRKAFLTLVVNINVFFAETLFTLSVKSLLPPVNEVAGRYGFYTFLSVYWEGL